MTQLRPRPVQALTKLYAKKGYKEAPPAFAINPLSLSKTEYATSNLLATIDASVHDSLRVNGSEELSYDFDFGTLQDTCEATFVLGFPFAKVAQHVYAHFYAHFYAHGYCIFRHMSAYMFPYVYTHVYGRASLCK